ATFFLVTGYVGTDRLLWTEEVVVRILSSPGRAIPACASSASVVVPSNILPRRELAVQMREQAKMLSDTERVRYLAALRRETNLDDALVDHELNDFMNWDEARSLAAMGFDIGSHTVEHRLLSRLSQDGLRTELVDSRRRLETELQGAAFAIAFPNGGRDDYNDDVIRECEQAGYRLGFTVAERFQKAGGSPFLISRIGIAGHSDLGTFALYASGLRDRLRRKSA
ncbi:MAG: polysaccharide deacetylase family protein, partial [Bryobacteraceae bacterium]